MSLPEVGEIVVVAAGLRVDCQYGSVVFWRNEMYLYCTCRPVAMAAGAERRVRVVVFERVEVLVAATAGAVVSRFFEGEGGYRLTPPRGEL